MVLEVMVVDSSFVKYKCLRLSEGFVDDNGKKLVRFSPVESGTKAVSILSENKYDLVILPYKSQGVEGSFIDGYRTAKEIREIPSDVKIIGNSWQWSEKEAKEVGLVNYTPIEREIKNYIGQMLKEREEKK